MSVKVVGKLRADIVKLLQLAGKEIDKDIYLSSKRKKHMEKHQEVAIEKRQLHDELEKRKERLGFEVEYLENQLEIKADEISNLDRKIDLKKQVIENFDNELDEFNAELDEMERQAKRNRYEMNAVIRSVGCEDIYDLAHKYQRNTDEMNYWKRLLRDIKDMLGGITWTNFSKMAKQIISDITSSKFMPKESKWEFEYRVKRETGFGNGISGENNAFTQRLRETKRQMNKGYHQSDYIHKGRHR